MGLTFRPPSGFVLTTIVDVPRITFYEGINFWKFKTSESQGLTASHVHHEWMFCTVEYIELTIGESTRKR